MKDIIKWIRTIFIKPKQAFWTPAYQSYFSAGDEAECFCYKCKALIEGDNKVETCPKCGRKNILYYK